MPDYTAVATATDPIIIECDNTTEDGLTSAVNLTGCTVALHLHCATADLDDLTFSSTDVPPLVAITDAAGGEVTFSPLATTFTSEDTWRGRLIITDSTGKTIPFPSEQHFTLQGDSF